MGERERDEGGQFSDRIPPERVLDAFGERDDLARPLTAQDVADGLGIARRTAHNKLNVLEERGQLATRKVGARGRVWWVPIRSHELVPGADALSVSQEEEEVDEQPLDDLIIDGEEPGTDSERAHREAATEAREGVALDEAVRQYLEEHDKPPKTAHGRGAVLDVFRELRERGPLTTSELQEAVYQNYTDKWSGERAMWNAIDRYLESIPGIEKAGYGEWGYAGDDDVRATIESAE